MNIEVKNSIKPVDYTESMKILEKRVEDVYLDKKDELLWILEHNTVYTAGKIVPFYLDHLFQMQ